MDNKWTPNPEITVLVMRRDGTILTPRQVEFVRELLRVGERSNRRNWRYTGSKGLGEISNEQG